MERMILLVTANEYVRHRQRGRDDRYWVVFVCRQCHRHHAGEGRWLWVAI